MGFLNTLFGGSSEKSESHNEAYPWLKESFGGWADQGSAGVGAISGLLGLGGDPAASQAAYKNFLNSSGFQHMLDTGSKAITGNAASRGLLKSGSTLKALNTFGQNLASTSLSNYLGQAGDLAKLSLGAGGLIGGAGQVSSSSGSKSDGGLGKFLGAIISDRRAKANIEKLSELHDGLGVYAFDYYDDIPDAPEGRQIGVMADEVAELRPWALGPVIHGYQSVNYGLL